MRCWHLCHAAAAGQWMGLFISALGDATGHLAVGGPPWTLKTDVVLFCQDTQAHPPCLGQSLVDLLV